MVNYNTCTHIIVVVHTYNNSTVLKNLLEANYLTSLQDNWANGKEVSLEDYAQFKALVVTEVLCDPH